MNIHGIKKQIRKSKNARYKAMNKRNMRRVDQCTDRIKRLKYDIRKRQKNKVKK